MAWATSDRRTRLPPNWPHIRARILKRDPWCRKCGEYRSAEVDHVNRGDDHSDSNLQGLCVDCHKRKSSNEGGVAAGIQRRKLAALRKRPPEPHPGGWTNEGKARSGPRPIQGR